MCIVYDIDVVLIPYPTHCLTRTPITTISILILNLAGLIAGFFQFYRKHSHEKKRIDNERRTTRAEARLDTSEAMNNTLSGYKQLFDTLMERDKLFLELKLQLGTLTQKVLQLESQKTALENQLADERLRRLEAEKERDRLAEQVGMFEVRIEELESERENNNKRMNELENRIKNLINRKPHMEAES